MSIHPLACISTYLSLSMPVFSFLANFHIVAIKKTQYKQCKSTVQNFTILPSSGNLWELMSKYGDMFFFFPHNMATFLLLMIASPPT
jgi:hypothetical protein